MSSASHVVIRGSNSTSELLLDSICKHQNETRKEGDDCDLLLDTKYYKAPLKFVLQGNQESSRKIEGILLVVDELSSMTQVSDSKVDPLSHAIIDAIKNTPETVMDTASIKIFCVHAPDVIIKKFEPKVLSELNSARVILCLDYGFEYLHLDVTKPFKEDEQGGDHEEVILLHMCPPQI